MSQNSARCECCSPDYRKEKLRYWPRQQHSTLPTFTATYFPLNLCLATCTCARLAIPMGLGSNPSKNSSILTTMSSWKSLWTSSYSVGSHWSCKGLIVQVFFVWKYDERGHVLRKSLGTTNWYESGEERRVRSSIYGGICHHSSRTEITVNFGRDQFYIWSTGQRHQDVCL